MKGIDDVPLVPNFARDRQRLFKERSRALMFGLLEVLSPHTQKREGSVALVPQLPVECQCPPVEDCSLLVVTPMPGERPCLAQGPGSYAPVGVVAAA